MCELSIVTGASQNHFKSLKQFLSSVNTNIIKCFVYDLGLNTESVEELKKYSIEYRVFDYSAYPSYYDIKINAGEYAWKPAIIYNTMKEITSVSSDRERILLWCDAGNIFRNCNISALSKHILENKLYSPDSRENVAYFTHPLTRKWFEIGDDNPILLKNNRNGAILGFYIDDPEIQSFIETFNKYASIKECIAPIGSNRTNHRQDQAVFTILYHKFMEAHPSYSTSTSYFNIQIHRDCD